MADVDGPALGLVETRGLIGAIEAADTMAKTASVRILSVEKTVPALMTVYVVGDVASVESAVSAGAAAAERVGQLVSRLVIPHPASGLRETLSGKSPGIGERVQSKSMDEMTVVELRALARTREGFPLQGRAVASANKRQLLEAFETYKRR